MAYQETDPTLVSARGTAESEKDDLASNYRRIFDSVRTANTTQAMSLY